MPRIDGDRLRELRRTRGWDVPEMARRLRQASDDSDPLPPPDALVRMVRRWEREGLNPSRAERYELAYARAFAVRPEELRGQPGTRQPAEREQPQPPAGAHAPGVIAGLAEALHVATPDYPARDRALLEHDVLLAWELRQSAQYARLADLITDLLRDIGSRQADAVPAVHTLNLASSLAKSLGAHEMSAILSDRAYQAGRQSGSTLLIGAAKMRAPKG